MNDRVIQVLKELQVRIAVEALARPKSENPSYEYGLAVGKYAGVSLAIDRVLALYRDEKGDLEVD